MPDKLDLILDSIQAVDLKVSALNDKLTEVRIENGKQDEKLAGLTKYLDAIAAKLRSHIEGHWGWVGTAAGLAALATAAVNLLKR